MRRLKVELLRTQDELSRLRMLHGGGPAESITSLVPFENCTRQQPTKLFHKVCLAASGPRAEATLTKAAALDPLLCQPPRHARFVLSSAAGGGNCSAFGFSNRQGTSTIFGTEVQRYEEPWCKGLAKGTYCIGPPMVLLTFNHTILNCSHAGADGKKTVCESGQYCGHDPTGDPVGQAKCDTLLAAAARAPLKSDDSPSPGPPPPPPHPTPTPPPPSPGPPPACPAGYTAHAPGLWANCVQGPKPNSCVEDKTVVTTAACAQKCDATKGCLAFEVYQIPGSKACYMFIGELKLPFTAQSECFACVRNHSGPPSPPSPPAPAPPPPPPAPAPPPPEQAFTVLWNSPFDGCLQCSSPQLSAQTAAKFSITANQDMAFVGDKIALNYAITAAFPGLRGVYSGATPCWALEADKTNCSYTPWTNITVVKNGGKQQTWRTVLNLFPPCTACRTQRSHVECCGSCTSGVPQAADVQAVAAHAAAVLTGDPRMHSNFSGLLVLDFEAWRPVSADNDALYSAAGYTLSLYTQYGRQLVQEQHPEWDMERVTAAAIQQFDAAAETMVTAALVACKLILPHAKITLCKQRPRSPPHGSIRVLERVGTLWWIPADSQGRFSAIVCRRLPRDDFADRHPPGFVRRQSR